jgi:hypothetical protein
VSDGEFFALASHLIDDDLVEDGPFGRVPTVDAKVFIVELATLGEILGLGSFDVLVERMEQSHRPAKHGEAALLPVPTELRDALGTLEAVDTVAEQWAATEELADWSLEMVRDLLLALRDLASGARNNGAELWLWSSL